MSEVNFTVRLDAFVVPVGFGAAPGIGLGHGRHDPFKQNPGVLLGCHRRAFKFSDGLCRTGRESVYISFIHRNLTSFLLADQMTLFLASFLRFLSELSNTGRWSARACFFWHPHDFELQLMIFPWVLCFVSTESSCAGRSTRGKCVQIVPATHCFPESRGASEA